MWGREQNFVEKYHPNKAVAVQAMNLFKDNAMSHFHETLQRRQRQMSLDRFFVKASQEEKDFIEPIDSRDSIHESENCPTQ